jgi:short-subunit dehydrogenase
MKNLENKAIIITGAGMGLGLATAKELASRGANLTLVDYNEKSLEEAKMEISTQNPAIKIVTVVADVSKEDAVKNYIDETVNHRR